MYEHAPGTATGFVAVFLTPLGDQVSGFVFLDFVNVPVSGMIAVSGELSLKGGVDASGPPPSFVLIQIANWPSSIDVVSRMLLGRFTHLHAEGTSRHPLSGRVDRELLNVKPTGRL